MVYCNGFMPFDKWYFITEIWSGKPFVDGPRNVFAFDCCYFGCDHGPVTAMGAQGVTTVTLWSDSYHQGSYTMSSRLILWFLFVWLHAGILNLAPEYIYKSMARIVSVCTSPHMNCSYRSYWEMFRCFPHAENYVINTLKIRSICPSDQFTEDKPGRTYIQH
jgi:hypothetical protein